MEEQGNSRRESMGRLEDFLDNSLYLGIGAYTLGGAYEFLPLFAFGASIITASVVTEWYLMIENYLVRRKALKTP